MLEFFKEKHPDILKDMSLVDHSSTRPDMGEISTERVRGSFASLPDLEGIAKENPFHLEGDLLTHTLMVLATMRGISDSDVDSATAMLHDIGKLYCFSERLVEETGEIRRNFSGHEGRSFFESIKYLKEYFPKGDAFDNFKITCALFAIANHGRLYSSKKEVAELLKDFDIVNHYWRNTTLTLITADRNGRIGADSVRGADYSLLGMRTTETNHKKPEEGQLTCTLLVGPPGSGKSTYVESLKDDNTVIISRDAIIEEYAETRQVSYGDAWRSLDQAEVDFLLNVKKSIAFKSGKNVVVDMTNLTKKGRRRFINVARQKKMFVKAVVFATSFETLVERRSGEKKVPTEVINNMCNKFTFPLGDEVDQVTIEITE